MKFMYDNKPILDTDLYFNWNDNPILDSDLYKITCVGHRPRIKPIMKQVGIYKIGKRSAADKWYETVLKGRII